MLELERGMDFAYFKTMFEMEWRRHGAMFLVRPPSQKLLKHFKKKFHPR